VKICGISDNFIGLPPCIFNNRIKKPPPRPCQYNDHDKNMRAYVITLAARVRTVFYYSIQMLCQNESNICARARMSLYIYINKLSCMCYATHSTIRVVFTFVRTRIRNIRAMRVYTCVRRAIQGLFIVSDGSRFHGDSNTGRTRRTFLGPTTISISVITTVDPRGRSGCVREL